MPAPVVLFAYSRPQHLLRTIEALRKNELASRTTLYLVSDAPASTAKICAVSEVRQIIEGTLAGFATVHRIYRSTNLGLAKNIITGVTEVIRRHGEAIVLEDDMETAPFFLDFMNDGLVMYRDNARVVSIHGYCYPVARPLASNFFLQGADCWGWATWQRGWDCFRTDGRALFAELKTKKLLSRLDFGGTYPFSRMLRDQYAGLNDSWAVRWYASALLAGGLTLYPGRSLVRNIGNDGSGRHSHATSVYDVALPASPISVQKIPLREDEIALAAFTDYFRATQTQGVLRVGADIAHTVRRILRMARRCRFPYAGHL